MNLAMLYRKTGKKCIRGDVVAVLLAFAGITAASPLNETPRLAVCIVVDQLFPEQIERLRPHLRGGFARLLEGGRSFESTWIHYAVTETGPGHATLATGVFPDRHGIIANEFYDRVDGSDVNCVDDAEVHGLRSAPGELAQNGRRVSPRRLRAKTLGDCFREQHRGARVISIAGKDRSAILMGGAHADLSLWWDTQVGGFASSTWYVASLPEWVAEWNASWARRASSWSWNELSAQAFVGSGTQPDDQIGEGGKERTFPHVLEALGQPPTPRQISTLAGQVFSTPLLDQFVLELGLAALKKWELGMDPIPDVLCLGFSACDVAGHTWGPSSREVTDLILRLDLELARLFDALDAQVGPKGWIACLSSDHGVLELPEVLQVRDVGAVRLSTRVLGDLVGAAKKVLVERYSTDFGVTWSEGLRFDANALRQSPDSPATVRSLVREVAIRQEWVAEAYTREELESTGRAGPEPWRRLFARSIASERGPDIALRLPPYTLVAFSTGTSHGSPYPYDRHVPLFFYGHGVVPGRSFDHASTVDALPTLLALFQVPLPENLDGQALPLD